MTVTPYILTISTHFCTVARCVPICIVLIQRWSRSVHHWWHPCWGLEPCSLLSSDWLLVVLDHLLFSRPSAVTWSRTKMPLCYHHHRPPPPAYFLPEVASVLFLYLSSAELFTRRHQQKDPILCSFWYSYISFIILVLLWYRLSAAKSNTNYKGMTCSGIVLGV